MTLNIHDAPPRRTMSAWIAAVTAVVIAAVVLAMTPTRAHAIAVPVPLGTAAGFGVLAGATVTNTGPTVVNGLNVGVSPGTAITGFTTSTPPGPGLVTAPGTLHSADAVAAQAKIDLTNGYNQAAGQIPPTQVFNDAPHEFGGQTLTPGVYKANVSAGITGTLTLDALGDPSAVWVFQIGSTLTTAAENSTVSLVNGASPCNVYWQIGSSATLGTNTTFVGTVLAHTSISATTGASVNGRLLADAGATGNGAVTLDSNRIFLGPCGTGGTGGTGGLITGGVIAGATTGGTTTGTTGSTTVGAIGGVPTGGGTGGALGGLLGGVLTTGGTTGGALGGLVAGTTTSGTTGATTGGGNGGATGGPGHDHGEKPGKPGGHDHGGQPEEHGGYDHGEKPEEHGGYDEHGSEPGEDDGYARVRH
jgi:hypothetical protein